MGFLTDLASGKSTSIRQAVDRGQGTWRQVFGTNKEESGSHSRPVPGGSWGRSAIAEPAAYKRLLQAMRSMAPGGWSDNRWEQTRHFEGANYIAIHSIGIQLQQAEYQVFKKDEKHPDGKRPITKDDPAEGDRLVTPYDLVRLFAKPNPRDSFGKLMYRWAQQQWLTGTSLTWMVPNRVGVPFEMYCIPTAIAIPQPAINPDYPDGYYRIQPIYPYGPFSSYPTPNSAVGAPIPAQWMLRFLFPHPLLHYDGFSPQTALNLQIDELKAMDKSRWYKMQRTVNPEAVLNFDETEGVAPLPEPEIERIRSEFENEGMGPENAGKLYISTPGARLEPWGAAPREMDYPQSWEQMVSFILGGHGITRPAAGMLEGSSYSVLFATLKQLYVLTLQPYCDDIASELTRHVAPFFGDDLIVDIRCKRIDDHDLTNAKISIGMQARCVRKNEVRKLLDLPVTQEQWGEEIAGTEPQMPGMGGGAPGGMPPMGAMQNGSSGPLGQGMEQPQEGSLAALLGGGAVPNGAKPEPNEVFNSRPQPGALGTGAHGPRKSFFGKAKRLPSSNKTLYNLIRNSLHSNGTSNGHE